VLITFKSKSYANILMMGEAGNKMLEMMDFGMSVPGAIDARDVATALANLKRALDKIPRQIKPAEDAEEDEDAISLHTRSIPLIELLEAAVADEEHVRWE
jgi:hypothetical protein